MTTDWLTIDWRYYADFVIFPAVVLLATLLHGVDAWWLILVPLGALLFTFVEYWTHRSLLHVFFWHGAHERHHTQPTEHVVFPLWYTPAIFVGFYIVMPVALFVGFVCGYLWFMALHHALHHWSLRGLTWLHRYAIWHNVHHLHAGFNFGITTPIWDRLFRTYKVA